MKLIKENFESLTYNSAEFEREDGTRVIVSPYISEERWAEIFPKLNASLNEKLPLLIEKFGKKK